MSPADTEKLIEDLRAVIHDAEELLRATAGQAGEHIAEARGKAEESLQAARSLLSVLGGVTDRAREVAGRAGSLVAKNPWVAVGVGAAIGLVLGLLLANRDGKSD